MTKVFVQCVPGLFKKKVSVQCVRGVFDQECESLKNNEGVKLEEKHFIKIFQHKNQQHKYTFSASPPTWRSTRCSRPW